MESLISSCRPSFIPSRPHRPSTRARPAVPWLPSRPSRTSGAAVASASRKRDDVGGGDYGGRLVDEGMVVLRRRLREMEMVERNYEPPSDWAEWEKRYYASYTGDVCRLAGTVQRVLMGTRPSVALGVLVLLLLSVPTSAVAVVVGLADAVSVALAGVHLG